MTATKDDRNTNLSSLSGDMQLAIEGLVNMQYAPGSAEPDSTVEGADATEGNAGSSGDEEAVVAPIPWRERNGQYPYLVRGAYLRCSCGTHTRKLNLPFSHGSYIGNVEYPLMNAMDNVPGEGSGNISPFGICQSQACPNNLGTILLKSEKVDPVTGQLHPVYTEDNVKGPPCMAIIVGPWQNTHPETMIGAAGETQYEAITVGSFLVCLYEGIIEPLTSGQPLLDRVMLGKLYESLSIEGLLEIDPEKLSPESQECYIEALNQRMEAMSPDDLIGLGVFALASIQTEIYQNHLDKRIEGIRNSNKGDDIANVPLDERNWLIGYYEARHPANAKKMNDFLNPIESCSEYEKHIRDIVEEIKYLSYASSDPYHTVLFNCLSKINIKDHHFEGNQYFQVGFFNTKNIYIDVGRVIELDSDGELVADGIGGYTVFFHEIGHAIDRILGTPSTALDEAITGDVRGALRVYIESQYPVPPTQQDISDVDAILDSLMANAPPMTSTGDQGRDAIAASVQTSTFEHFRDNVLNRLDDDTASDVYGGVTDNRIHGNWGHWLDDEGKSYWVDKGHLPSSEFFANAFSRYLTGYDDAIKSIENNLATPSRLFVKMMENAK